MPIHQTSSKRRFRAMNSSAFAVFDAICAGPDLDSGKLNGQQIAVIIRAIEVRLAGKLPILCGASSA